MRKIKKRTLILLFSITPVFFYMIFSSKTIEAMDKPITLIPDARLFEVTNMKPGDTITKVQKIHNQSNDSFSYVITTEKESGSDLLYNQLDLQVIADNTEIYNGKLKYLNLSKPLKLNKNSQHGITFQFHFPIDSGNEYQGLITSVAFIYTAEADHGNPPDDGDPPNPPDDGDPPDPPDDGDPPDPPDDGDPPDPPDDGDPPDPPDDGDPPDPPDDGDPPDPPDHNEPPPNDNEPPNTNEPPSNNPAPTKPADPPSKDTGSLPQTGEENPILIILSGFFISLAGLGLLLIKKSIIPNPFKRG
jgi:LPXTG-motif cell wall-anchored protein